MSTYYNNGGHTTVNGWSNAYDNSSGIGDNGIGMVPNYGGGPMPVGPDITNGGYIPQQNGHIPSNYQSNQQQHPYLNGTIPNSNNGTSNGSQQNHSGPSPYYYSPSNHMNHQQPPPQINGYHQQPPMAYSNYDQVGYVSKAIGYNYCGDLEWGTQAIGSESMEQQLFLATINSGINFDNYESIPVDVSPADAPPAINTFSEALLHPFVAENVDRSGYSKPTPVQKHSIPTLLANRDLMSCAQTGSGKTAAFLLPIISHILTDGSEAMKQPQLVNGRRVFYPAALVLSPTRELAIQIHKESAKFSYRTNLITAILYGGRENYREQLNRLRNGCHILIATPGRLIDVLEQGIIGLQGVRYLVLDEADRMLDMGFEPQIRKVINNGMPPKTNRVTAMFSATFPKEIQQLAQEFLKQNYVFLAVGRVGSTSDNIEQCLLWVEEHQKRHSLGNILENEEIGSLVLIFVETKRSANELSYFLTRSGLRSVPIHGDLKQFERERNLEMFKSGNHPVLVATAVAARGLDIPNVRHVINYDLPSDIDEYVHRIGRTGRCGNLGKATSFFNDKNRFLARDLLEIVKEAHQVAPDWLVRIAGEGRYNGGGGSRGGYRGSGNSGRFGGTDHRRGGGMRGGGMSGGFASTWNNTSPQQQQQHPNSGGWQQRSFGNGASAPSNGGGYANSGFVRSTRGGSFNNSRGGGNTFNGGGGYSQPKNHGYAGYGNGGGANRPYMNTANS